MAARETMERPNVLRNPVFLFAVAAVLAALIALSSHPPSPRGLDTPPDEFSAERALGILGGLLAESQPHVAGSPLNRVVRSRIETFLREQGYQPEVQSLFHCHPGFGGCARVENVIAVKPGSDGHEAVLLTAHYDSSWAGPGAGDDGAGTAAVLEIARMLAKQGEFRNDVVFLLSDGEEQGLVGAHAFAAFHPLYQKVRAVVNLEARGVTGPSTMFETADGNRTLIRVLSQSLDRPVANSLAYEVYRRMPNDTDFSVYRSGGAQGANFAFSGGVALYHSQLDDIAHLDAGSLQHHGQNAWSMVQALANRDIHELKSREDAAYIDIFSRLLWHYPLSIASGLTMVLAVLVLLGISVTCRTAIRFTAIVWAAVAQLAAAALLLTGAWLLDWPLGYWVETNPIEHPSPWMARLCLLALLTLVAWLVGKVFSHRTTFGSAALVSWASFAALAFWLDFNLPAASFVALIPMAAFLVGMLLDQLLGRSRQALGLASLFGFIAAAYIGLYHFYMLDVVLSFKVSYLKVAPLLLLLLPFLPAWSGRGEEAMSSWWPALVFGAVIAITALSHQFIPGFSKDRPRGMNLVYLQEPNRGEALIYLESPGNEVDHGYAEAHGFADREIPIPYTTAGVRPARQVPSLGLPGATISGVEIGSGDLEGPGYVVRFSVQAPVESQRLLLLFPDSVNILEGRIDGVPALDSTVETKRGRAPRAIAIAYPGSEPMSVELRVEQSPPFSVTLASMQAFPSEVSGGYRANWPNDARPYFNGWRAGVLSEYQLSAN